MKLFELFESGSEYQASMDMQQGVKSKFGSNDSAPVNRGQAIEYASPKSGQPILFNGKKLYLLGKNKGEGFISLINPSSKKEENEILAKLLKSKYQFLPYKKKDGKKIKIWQPAK